MTISGPYRRGGHSLHGLMCTTSLTGAQSGSRAERGNSVATAPGGGADRTARFIQKLIQEKKLLAVPVVVVNKPGAGGGIGIRHLNQHAGNGHYVQMYSPNVLAGCVVGNVPFNYTDVTPFATFYSENLLLAVRTESPIKSGRDMLERLRQDPKSLSLTVGIGLGNMNHIGAALPMRAGGVDVKAVKAVVFNTVAEGVTAVVGGHIDMVAATPSTVLAQMQAGRLRVLGIAAPRRVHVSTRIRLHGRNRASIRWPPSACMIGARDMTPDRSRIGRN